MPFRLIRPPSGRAPAETPVRAERFRAALQVRMLGLAGLDDGKNVRALYLERGEAVLRRPDAAPLPLAGPVMGWFPWREGMRLELSAGAQGGHLLLGRATLLRALARSPETAELGFMADRSLILRPATDEGHTTVAACFAGILSETLHPGAMTTAVVESFLRILLVQLYRGQAAGGPLVTGRGSGGKALVGRFAALVEGHVRDRWTVARYAQELRISVDRLNDICLRAHGRPPGRLIRERLVIEAKLYLEQSSLGIEQIAGVLGFSGAPQFNRFFREMTGTPPGRYRAGLAGKPGPGPQTSAAPYSWP